MDGGAHVMGVMRRLLSGCNKGEVVSSASEVVTGGFYRHVSAAL